MRFSLRSLFIVIACTSIYCAVVFAIPVVLSFLALTVMTLLFPPIAVGGIVYGRGAWRAFWIGCAASGFVPCFIAAYMGTTVSAMLLLGDYDSEDVNRWYCAGLAFCHALVVVYGMIVVAMRWVHEVRITDARRDDSSDHYSVIHRRIALDQALVIGSEGPED